jgi:hypothetical protein
MIDGVVATEGAGGIGVVRNGFSTPRVERDVYAKRLAAIFRVLWSDFGSIDVMLIGE